MKTFVVVVCTLGALGVVRGQDCAQGSFECGNGLCVPASYICDGDDDCGDMGDEVGESGICPDCPSGYWKCGNGRCINELFTCDGDNDCLDWSDEQEESCPCQDTEIRCKVPPSVSLPGSCIPPEWICDEDGIWDCPLGDDETDCAHVSHSHKRTYKNVQSRTFQKQKKSTNILKHFMNDPKIRK